MSLKVEMISEGAGVLDTMSAPNAAAAAKAAIEMIRAAGEMYPGDRIEISGTEDES